MRPVIAIGFLSLALIPATQVIASDPQNARSVVAHLFETADVDQSGTLSPAEYGKAELDAYGVGFEASDRSGDGDQQHQTEPPK